ncbi:MAG: GerMN domain-containing protein, partial [Chloroflexota bacterium]|nr:GerMN domain-containing protein [Chloroflexota bacterium]
MPLHRRYVVWLCGILLLMMMAPLGLLEASPAHAARVPAFQVAAPFRDYYAEHQGLRVLGVPLTGLLEVDGHPAQYFEKGRLEDHRDEVTDPSWAFMYGRLTAELIEREAQQELSANATSSTYGDIRRAAESVYRHAAPSGFEEGTQRVPDGVFVPYDPRLRARPGYIVPLYFWSYINRADLFPGGWLHDIGLPMTDAFVADAVKDGTPRQIMMQAFERAVLTYDPLNPPEWQVERGNIGADALRGVLPHQPIETPPAGARVTLPLPILARVGKPGDPITIVLRWRNGVTLKRTVQAIQGEDGGGLVLTNLAWQTESRPPQPVAHDAMLELRDGRGNVLATQLLQVLRWDDPGVQRVDVYWLLGADHLQAAQRIVPQTPRIGTAAIEELLWGPSPGNLAGFQTAIPSPHEVLNYPGREADWGPRVTLRSLVIEDGVATADFSQELRAYGGGTARAQQIRDQITHTLLQFPTVRKVRILIEGQSNHVLEGWCSPNVYVFPPVGKFQTNVSLAADQCLDPILSPTGTDYGEHDAG